jgi:hypothetical protein
MTHVVLLVVVVFIVVAVDRQDHFSIFAPSLCVGIFP